MTRDAPVSVFEAWPIVAVTAAFSVVANWWLPIAIPFRIVLGLTIVALGILGLLGLLAVASLTGVALWINDAFDVHRGAWAWGETAALTGAALFVVVIIAWARR